MVGRCAQRAVGTEVRNYAVGVGTMKELRDGEYRVVAITPIARGVAVPLLITLVAIAIVVVASNTWHWVGVHSTIIAAVLVGPCALILGGRLWRWRSHKIIVTNQRVLVVGGVANRRQRAIELIDVVSVGVDQRWHERIARRGHVIVETTTGVVVLERVRRPDALWRVIDHQRQQIDRRDRARLDHADELSRALDAGDISGEEYEERWRHLFGPDSARG